ncbi:MAG: hypothetical protein TYPL_4380 [Candidatus Tyloplasma litorale]|nr:MAG: hypothetical protein TYPL_4380 [Mycoplasmatales bacterium]
MIEKIVTAIVLEKISFNDEHLVKILSEGGNVITLKAKGLDLNSSKNRMSLGVFNEVEIEYFTSQFSRNNTGRLKTARIIKEFIYENNYNSINILNFCKNILLQQNNNSNQIYKSIQKIKNSLENNFYNFQFIFELLILKLRQNGYKPIVDKCALCQSNQNIKGFSIYEGGLICDKHEESIKYELEPSTLRKIITINTLKDPLYCNNLNLNQNEILKIKSMYKMFFENQLGISLFLIEKT